MVNVRDEAGVLGDAEVDDPQATTKVGSASAKQTFIQLSCCAR
jgi:hypothetical protein